MNNIFLKIAALLITTAVLTACNGVGTQSSTKTVATVVAGKAEVSQVLSFSSNIEGNRETILAAKAPGQISTIKVDIGDTVYKGNLLAALSAQVDSANYNVAKTAKESSEKNLDTSKTLLEKQIEEVKVAVLTSKENLKRAENGKSDQTSVLQEQLKNAELSYDLAKLNHENIIETVAQQEENILDSAESLIVQSSILSKGIISYIYGLNNNTLSDNFDVDNDFTAEDKYKTATETAVRSLESKAQELENFYNSSIKDKNPSEYTLEEGRKLAEETMQDIKDALQEMNNVLSDSVANEEITNDNLNSYRSSLFNYATQAESMNLSGASGTSTGLVGIEQSLESLEVSRKNQLEQATKQMQIAEQNYLMLKESADAQTNDLKSQVNLMSLYLMQSKNALETAQAQKNNQLSVLESQVNQANSQLGLAGAMLSNTKVYAPYSGVIAEKYLDEGAVVNAGTPVLKIADISKLKLVIFVPENQIKYFKIWQKGKAFSESFPGEEFETIVERISPKVEVGSKKVRVELSISDSEKVLKIGMYMNLKIAFDSTEEVLALPPEAIQDFYGEKTIFINKDGIAVRKSIITGMSSENYVEIIEGVEEGDDVIIKGLSSLRDGDNLRVINDNTPYIIRPSQQWKEKLQN